jgi:hypothetical protein
MKFQCITDKDKTKKSDELKTYLTKKYSSQEFSFRIPLGDLLNDCCYHSL